MKNNADDQKIFVLFNLLIEIDTEYKKFENGLFGKAADHIEGLGLAINWAKKSLSGEWHVLSDGTLMRGSASADKCEQALIDVSGNMLAITLLSEILENKSNPCDYGIFAHHLADYIKHDGKNFYVNSIRRAYKMEKNIKKICQRPF